MSNSGISSQVGFEFQKLVFLYYVLESFKRFDSIASYELDDDIQLHYDLSAIDDSVCKISTLDTLVQCKTGEISSSVFRKVIKNWLLNDVSTISNFVFFSENSFSFSFDDEKQNIINEIVDDSNSGKRSDSIMFKLYQKYNSTGTFDLSNFNNDFLYIKNNFRLVHFSYLNLQEKCFQLYKDNHAFKEGATDLILMERFSELMKRFIFAVSERLSLTKSSLNYSYRELNELNHDVSSRIKVDNYSVDYSIFRNDARENREQIFEGHEREVNFLKKVVDKEDSIFEYLIRELFYSKYRNFNISVGRSADINDIEATGYSNYVLLNGSDYSLRELFKEVMSANFTVNRSDFISVCQKGCYIYLSSDNAIDSQYFIDWNGENAK